MKELHIDAKEDTHEDEEQSLPKEDGQVCMSNVNDIDVYNGSEYGDKHKLEEEKPINNKHLNKLTKNKKELKEMKNDNRSRKDKRRMWNN